ncbi:peptidylprolyl isomerase [Malassezia caprae]|uniref:Peptidylprolyl isomerase n=1 Tax=Malassezia caprae TaxID=1381934 RepID=A0AAF0EAJ6_9BASI|nr:peptidylprolyl isomerase [Malassezia caprae]
MGHGTNDKLFITPSEYSGVYGQHGATTGVRTEKSVIVPFHMCAITHQPWTAPACLVQDGLVCDRETLEAFVQQYHVSPATGEPASVDDILALHIGAKDDGTWQDPVSLRELTDHSHLVAIRPTGYVYLYDTVQQLNLKTKSLRDLVTDEPFVKADILTLQDPHDPAKRRMQDMYHVKHQLTLKSNVAGDDVNAAATGSTKALIEKIRREKEAKAQVARPAETPAPDAPRTRLTNRSTGMTAASFTSSGLTPRTKTERLAVDEEEVMFESVARTRAKGLVRLQTNFGALNVELHCDKAPRTCYNFLALCRQGTYNGTVFHRNIPGFMIQGGDPTGTGRGGQSIWGKPFADELCLPGAMRHTDRGVLSMANKGYNTNGSQFFVTYRPTPHLDAKHTVFGHLVSDAASSSTYSVLDALERVPNEPGTERPIRPIELLEAVVFEDPFDDYQQKRNARYRRENPDDQEKVRRDAKRRKREEDKTTWLGTRLASSDSHDAAPLSMTERLTQNDKHGLAGLVGTKPPAPTARPRGGRAGGWGDFAHW